MITLTRGAERIPRRRRGTSKLIGSIERRQRLEENGEQRSSLFSLLKNNKTKMTFLTRIWLKGAYFQTRNEKKIKTQRKDPFSCCDVEIPLIQVLFHFPLFSPV